MPIIATSNKHQNHHTMKKTALLIVFALFTLILAMGDLAKAQVIITPTNPGSPSYSSALSRQSVYKCIATTTCTINDKNELVNCEQKEEITNFVLDITPDYATVTIVKPLKKQKYYIESFDSEKATGTLELHVYDESGEFIKYATITIFGSNNLISVQSDLGFDEFDSSWDSETINSRIGGTMEIYDMEH